MLFPIVLTFADKFATLCLPDSRKDGEFGYLNTWEKERESNSSEGKIMAKRMSIKPTVDGYVFNGLGLLKPVTERNLGCLERAVESALAGQSDKIKKAKAYIDKYKNKPIS